MWPSVPIVVNILFRILLKQENNTGLKGISNYINFEYYDFAVHLFAGIACFGLRINAVFFREPTSQFIKTQQVWN